MTHNEINQSLIANKDFDGLLKANKRLIMHMAYKMGQPAEHLEDLIQCGSIGLFKAYQTYNQELNPNFIGYAKFYIKKEIMYYIDFQLDTIRIKSKYTSKNNKGIKSYNVISTNTKLNIGEDAEITIEDTLSQPIEDDVPDERLSVLNRIILTLSQKEQDIIKMFYGIDTKRITQEQIGEHYGISRQAISLRIEKIQNKIKEKINKVSF